MEYLKKDLQNFYKDAENYDYSIYSLLFGISKEFIYKLPVTLGSSTKDDSERTTMLGYELYRDVLLPEFLDFAEFDVLNFDKNKYKERFLTLLNRNIENFNYSPVIFNNNIYFIKYTSKGLAGLPKNQEDKLSFLESKELFNYKYYRFNEKDFLKIVTSHINLYERQEKTLKQNKLLLSIVFIAVIIISILFQRLVYGY